MKMVESHTHWHLHPIANHFPIALFISAMILEIFSLIFKKDSLHRTARHIYILATLLTPLAVQTGLSEQLELHLKHPILFAHKRFALWAMWVSLASLPILYVLQRFKPAAARIIFVLFVLFLGSSVAITGYYGGRMVYEYGIGVDD